MKKLTTPYQIMIIIVAALVVYYPTLFGEICLIDDYDAISSFISEETFSLKQIFFPRSSDGGYYRPLIMLSYVLDKQLWFLHERLMHFESVVAHLFNALLVFCVCREAMYLHLKRRQTYLPLVAALLFALHPISTESVNWISGRTDIMMGTFVLVSILFVLRYIQSKSKMLLATAIICGLIACLAKEAAFGYLIGLPLLAFYKVNTESVPEDHVSFAKVRLFFLYFIGAFLNALLFGSYWLVLGISLLYIVHILCQKFELKHLKISAGRIARWAAVFMCSLAVVVGLFVFLRKLVFTSNVSKIGQTITLMFADLNYSVSLFLGAVGFYVKKFFIPTPLNFFILEIDPLYDFVGIVVLLLVCHLLMSKSLPALLTLSGLLLLLPALPFAFGTIAWTAYAERYIYLSSAFWIVALCLWSDQWLERNSDRNPLVTFMVVIVCLSVAGITFQRNIVWQSNVTLMRNTVAQTPNIRKLRNIYIRALVDDGDIDEALKQYKLAAVALPSLLGDEQAALNIGNKLIAAGRNQEAQLLYQDAVERTQGKSEPLLKATLKQLCAMQAATSSPRDQQRYADLIVKYSVKLPGKSQPGLGTTTSSTR